MPLNDYPLADVKDGGDGTFSVYTSNNGFQAWSIGVTFTDRERADRVAAAIREAMEEEGIRR